MELKPIELNIDRSQEIYSSTNCQLVINAIIESFTKNGFNKPWIGYFACKNNQMAGPGGFVENLNMKKLKLLIGHLRNLKGRESLPLSVINLLKFQNQLTPQ